MNAVRPGLHFTQRKLQTGPTLSCAESGPDAAPETLLFLHGYSDCWLSAAPILPRLPASWRVLVPDQRGHGASERPAAGYDIASLAADAAALLEAAGAPPATVVGHSMGSMVAQRLAIDHPERVKRLMLVAGAPTCAGAAVRELEQQLRGFGETVPREFVVGFQESTTARPLSPAFLEAIVAEGARMPARVWRALLRGFLAFDTRAELAKIAVPTRIVWGERDAIFGFADQQALRTGIPGAELVVYLETGHSPHWEDPARFAFELAAFVEDGAIPSTRRQHASC